MDIARLEAPGRIRAEFYFDEDLNKDLCKISIVGDPSNLIKKVTPELISNFPKEWELYQKQGGNAREQQPVGGTPLREIPGVDRDAATVLRYHAIRNVEEFVAIDEETARQMGPGFLTFYRSAKNLLDARDAAKLRAMLDKQETEAKKRGPGRPRKEEEQTSLEASVE